MLYKTKGIVLHHIKYSETSVIATIYTETLGRQSYLINGVRSKKSKIKANILQPLFLLNMEVYHKPKRELQRVKEIQPAFVFNTIPYDLKKTTIALFIAEVLYKTIREHEPNQQLFDYLFNSIQLLDIKKKGLANFHLFFLTHLTKNLGFFPENNYSENHCFFDLQAGYFAQIKPLHEFSMEKNQSKIFSKVLEYSDNQHEDLNINYNERTLLLEKIITYYTLHSQSIIKIKSFDILKEVFHSS